MTRGAGGRPASGGTLGLALLLMLALVLTACTGPVQPTPSPPASPGATPSTPSTPSPTPTATPTPTAAAPTQSVVFGNPWSDDPHAVHAVAESAIRIIDETPSGETIMLSIFNITSPPVRQALIRAHDRGVHVHLVVNAVAAHKKQVRRLRAAMGVRTSARSWIVVRTGGVRMHSKFLLASHSGGKAWVAWVSSGNMTNRSGAGQANESLTTTGDKQLYRFLATQFDLLSKGVTDAGRLARSASTPTSRVQTFPLPEGGKANDPVDALLSDVTCRVGDQRTVIRMGHLMFKKERGYLVTRLRDLAAAGCDVRMVGRTQGWDRSVVRGLTRPGAGHIDLWSAHGASLHTKITTITGWNAAGQPITVAMVGTHNLSGRALTFVPGRGVNDELAVTVWNTDVVDSYNAFVDRVIRNHSVPVAKAGRTPFP